MRSLKRIFLFNIIYLFQVGLFEVDPTVIKTATPLIKVNVDSHPWNYFRTEVSLEYSKLPGGWDKDVSTFHQSLLKFKLNQY